MASTAVTVGDMIVTGTFTGIVTALIGGAFGYRLNKANAKAVVENSGTNSAKAINDMSTAFARTLLDENTQLRQQMAAFEQRMDAMRGQFDVMHSDMRAMSDRMALLITLLNRAIPVLETNGVDTAEYRAAVGHST